MAGARRRAGPARGRADAPRRSATAAEADVVDAVHRARHRVQGGAGQAHARPALHARSVCRHDRDAIVGAGVDRVDGPLKVRRQPRPTPPTSPTRHAHAALVRSTIAAGRIVAIDDSAAVAAPGVLDGHHARERPEARARPRCGCSGPAAAAAAAGRPHPPPRAVRRHRRRRDAPKQAAAAARLVEVDYEPATRRCSTSTTRAASRRRTPGIPTRSAATSTPGSPRPTSSSRRRTPPRRTPTTRWACSPPSPPGTATPSRSTTPRSGPRTSQATLAGDVRDPAGARSGSSRRTSAAVRRRPAVWPHVILTALAARASGARSSSS